MPAIAIHTNRTVNGSPSHARGDGEELALADREPQRAPDSRSPNDAKGGAAGRLDFLDSLRGLAALWVVLSHLWISQFGMNAHHGALGLFSNWLIYSHFAVDVFIVLSGYCLTIPTLRHRRLGSSVMEFYGRRARRILPPYYAALGIAVVLGMVMHEIDHGTLAVSAAAVAVNLAMLQDLFLQWNIFDGPLWSVAVEWRIYFLFPMLLWTLFRYGRRATLLSAALAGYGATAFIMLRHPAMLLACPWYLLLFAMGMCAAASADQCGSSRTQWADRAVLAMLACAAVAVAVYPVTEAGGSKFGLHMYLADTLVGSAAAFLLVGLHRRQMRPGGSRLVRVLSWGPLVRLGGISYSLYLIHILIIIALSRIGMAWAPYRSAEPLVRLAILTALALPSIFALSRAYYQAVERPFLRKPAQNR